MKSYEEIINKNINKYTTTYWYGYKVVAKILGVRKYDSEYPSYRVKIMTGIGKGEVTGLIRWFEDEGGKMYGTYYDSLAIAITQV